MWTLLTLRRWRQHVSFYHLIYPLFPDKSPSCHHKLGFVKTTSDKLGEFPFDSNHEVDDRFFVLQKSLFLNRFYITHCQTNLRKKNEFYDQMKKVCSPGLSSSCYYEKKGPDALSKSNQKVITRRDLNGTIWQKKCSPYSWNNHDCLSQVFSFPLGRIFFATIKFLSNPRTNVATIKLGSLKKVPIRNIHWQ